MQAKQDVTFPDLYSESKAGKKMIWKATVHEDPLTGFGIAFLSHGYVGGELQTEVRECREGRNLGRANATTPFEQCVNETRRRWLDKRDKKGYYETTPHPLEETTKCAFYAPMLAHTYADHPEKIHYPCFVQPKLDGLRCITYLHRGHVRFQSRTGGEFVVLDHLVPALHALFRAHPGLILDGELYTMEIPFEELVGLVKRRQVTDEERQRLLVIHYHIYDIVDETLPYDERFAALQHLLRNAPPELEKVETHFVQNFGEAKTRFTEWVANGYEGMMLRNREGRYRCKYRSYDLQKYKEFQEEEFPIVGFRQAEGRDQGTVIWVCRTVEGHEFSVRPRGSIEQRKEWFENGAFYIGKPLTVIFQEWSEMGIPRFPVGKSIREGF